MTLAVLGGSFDPVHNGHLAMARFVLHSDLAEQVVVVPAYCSPFKSGSSASAADRLKMVELAFGSVPGVQVDDLEIKRGGPSYTVQTLRTLGEQNPGKALCLVLGADNASGFFRWREPEEILHLARVIVLGRRGHAMEIPPAYQASFLLHPDFDLKMSSTEIRAMLARGEKADQYLPAGVSRYIQSRGLYRTQG